MEQGKKLKNLRASRFTKLQQIVLEPTSPFTALVLLAIGQFVHSISGATGLFMNMTGNQKALRNIMLIAAVLNIGINIILIPSLGIYGAAIAAMVSLIAWNITTLIYIKMKFGKTTGYFPLPEFL
jgi:O-antigen/teichoic acid export membrane protein